MKCSAHQVTAGFVVLAGEGVGERDVDVAGGEQADVGAADLDVAGALDQAGLPVHDVVVPGEQRDQRHRHRAGRGRTRRRGRRRPRSCSRARAARARAAAGCAPVRRRGEGHVLDRERVVDRAARVISRSTRSGRAAAIARPSSPPREWPTRVTFWPLLLGGLHDPGHDLGQRAVGAVDVQADRGAVGGVPDPAQPAEHDRHQPVAGGRRREQDHRRGRRRAGCRARRGPQSAGTW